MRSRASGPSLSLSPASFTATAGSAVTMDILLDTAGESVDGADVYSLRFDPKVLQVEDDDSVKSGVQITPGVLLPNTILNKVDNAQGTVQFSQLAAGGTTFTGTGTLATIHFNAIAAGTSAVKIDFSQGMTNDSNVAGLGTDLLASVINSSISVVVPPTPLPVPTPSPISTPDTTSPVVSITNPVNGGKIAAANSVVAVTATDNVKVTKVEIRIDNILQTTDTTVPYTYKLNANKLKIGTHSISAKAYDAAGNIGTASISVAK